MTERHKDSMFLKTSPTVSAKSLPEDLFRGRRTTSIIPSQCISPGWAEKYHSLTHQSQVKAEFQWNTECECQKEGKSDSPLRSCILAESGT